MKKKDRNYIWLCFITIGIIILSLGKNHLFGSTTDWFSQHIIYPDYFRKLFYETGNLFPNFAAHIGAGQNIYHFSYYGLLNPIYMISYLFPFIKMMDYLMIVSILSLLASVCLCYFWLKKHFNKRISFVSTILFLCASPFIFHFHRHLMFVNYMPFLLLALLGVERHFEKKKSGLLVFGIFMMIMTSYFYSVGGLLAITLYDITYYLKTVEKVTLKNFFQEGIKFAFPIILGIGLSMVLLLPTIYVILNGRTDSNTTVTLTELLLPNIQMGNLLYSTYSLGLTSIAFLSLVFNLIDKRKESRFLTLSLIILLIVPIFAYLLNGMLYIRAKVFIPFLPLFILEIAYLFYRIENKEAYYLPSLLFSFLVILVVLLKGYNDVRFLIDLTITVGAIFLFLFFRKKTLLYAPLVIFSIILSICTNYGEGYVTFKEYQTINKKDHLDLIEETTKNDTSFYRMNHYYYVSKTINKVYNMDYYSTSLYSSTYHDGYKDFFQNEFRNSLSLRNILDLANTKNGLFNMYMGVKYFVTEDSVPIGYEKVKDQNKVSLYENKDVLPIGYASSKISSLKEYENTSYPYNIENLYQTIVVDKTVEKSFEHKIKEVSLNYSVENNDLEIKKQENGYLIHSKKKNKLRLNLEESIENQFLFIQFDLKTVPSCTTGDISIKINGERNKLTCAEWTYYNENESFEYVVSSNEAITTLEIEFTKGEFDIQNIKTYLLDYSEIQKRRSEIDEFVISKEKTKGDKISGHIDVKEDGYFILNIPYDSGFEVKANGEKVSTEVVNYTFLGFPLQKGSYDIDITYQAPFQKEGMILSIISLGLCGCMLLIQNKKR